MPYSVTTKATSLREVLTGPCSVLTMRLPPPAVEGKAIMGLPPVERAAPRRKSPDPPAAPPTELQFDINPDWPSLITYSHQHGLEPVKVVPNVQQNATRYLVADDRDFFTVYRRDPGPISVPFA